MQYCQFLLQLLNPLLLLLDCLDQHRYDLRLVAVRVGIDDFRQHLFDFLVNDAEVAAFSEALFLIFVGLPFVGETGQVENLVKWDADGLQVFLESGVRGENCSVIRSDNSLHIKLECREYH